MKHTFLWAAVAAIGLALSAGGQQEAINLDELTKAMQALQGAQAGAAVAVVDFRELRALLPESLDGFQRKSASGEKNSAMGFTVSQAEASFASEAGGALAIKFMDNGGAGGLMAFAQSAWAAADIDRETDTGFERTATYQGHKVHEEYDREDRRGKIAAIVGGRFHVEISGSDVSWEEILAALSKIELDKLAELKPAAP